MCMVPSVVSAQSDSTSSFSFSANIDLMSRYIWRGQEYGQSPSIQPGLSLTWKGFTLGGWGAYKVTGPGEQETDFYLSKTIQFFTVAVWDYWVFCDTAKTNYFDYKPHSTGHLLELQLVFSGNKKIPFNFMGSYFFYGADTTRSIYLELQYFHSFGPVDFLAFTGFQAKGTYYAPVPAFVNLGITASNTIVLTKNWSLPISLSAIMNPYRKTVYLLAGISVKFE
jgi:hypothetical protein